MLKTVYKKSKHKKTIMKLKLFIILAMWLVSWDASAQVTPCSGIVNVTLLEPAYQSGAHNYFGAEVTLNKTYTEDVVVTGFIHDDDDPTNIEHPFEITVPAGYSYVATALTFYETLPTKYASLTIVSVTPYIVSDGTVYFRTTDACDSVTNQLINYTGTFADSLQASHNSLDAIIELNHGEFAEFMQSIVDYGVGATAIAYSIDSNALDTYLTETRGPIRYVVDSITTLLFGNTPFDDLTETQYQNLAQSIMDAYVVTVASPTERAALGNPVQCALAFLLQMQTAAMRYGQSMVIMKSMRNSQWAKDQVKDAANRALISSAMAAWETYESCN